MFILYTFSKFKLVNSQVVVTLLTDNLILKTNPPVTNDSQPTGVSLELLTSQLRAGTQRQEHTLTVKVQCVIQPP